MTAIPEPREGEPASSEGSPPEAPKLGFFSQLALASHLDSEAWAEVARDPSSTWKIVLLVALAGVARGSLEAGDFGVAAIVNATGITLVAWLLIGSLLWRLATRNGGRAASWGEAIRGTGLAAYPFLLLFLGLAATSVPGIIASLLAFTHGLAAYALLDATRAIFQLPTRRALVVCALAIGIPLLPLLLVLVPRFSFV